ncbi:MAG: hypothetical protein NZ516_11780 [Raineya sp.]|nr:hypothetical protein [Raineya sp.]
MIKVKVTCSVKRKFVSTETFVTEVDSATYGKSLGMDSKKELSSWAKRFFPDAEWVQVHNMEKIS